MGKATLTFVKLEGVVGMVLTACLQTYQLKQDIVASEHAVVGIAHGLDCGEPLETLVNSGA